MNVNKASENCFFFFFYYHYSNLQCTNKLGKKVYTKENKLTYIDYITLRYNTLQYLTLRCNEQ